METEKQDPEKAKEAAKTLYEWFERGAYQPPELFIANAAAMMTDIAYHLNIRKEVHGEEEPTTKQVVYHQEDWRVTLAVFFMGAMIGVFIGKFLL